MVSWTGDLSARNARQMLASMHGKACNAAVERGSFQASAWQRAGWTRSSRMPPDPQRSVYGCLLLAQAGRLGLASRISDVSAPPLGVATPGSSHSERRRRRASLACLQSSQASRAYLVRPANATAVLGNATDTPAYVELLASTAVSRDQAQPCTASAHASTTGNLNDKNDSTGFELNPT